MPLTASDKFEFVSICNILRFTCVCNDVESRLAPAWIDSDDENVAIDLTKTDRLR